MSKRNPKDVLRAPITFIGGLAEGETVGIVVADSPATMGEAVLEAIG